MDAAPIGYLLCDDLVDASRIEGLAKSLGVQLTAYRTPADLLAAANTRAPACVLIDVHHSRLDIAEFVKSLKAVGKPLIVGFGSHVAADVLKQARLAGCDLVQPRSQFFAELFQNLPTWITSPQC